ncbi:hypothetical protein BT69DRAFT_1344713 [Atractiella rhizophila]|nr:hypothetical protein BT69DRAFT_1344713 [Atractiella rhizophila]
MSTTAPPDPAALEAIFKKLEKDLDVSRVYFICCMSVLIWDWIVTFPSEYKYIWRTPWSIAKVLFLFNRYYTLAVVCPFHSFYNQEADSSSGPQ